MEPLSEPELRAAVAALRARRPDALFSEVVLDEDKAPGADTARRRARATLYARETNTTTVAVVDVASGAVLEERDVPGVQPAMSAADYELVERLVQQHPAMAAAAARRGVDVAQVRVDPWCVGHFGAADDPSRRLAFPILYVQRADGDNFYQCPLEGIRCRVDLGTEQVIEFEDEELVPLPPADPLGDYPPPEQHRTDLKPLHVEQPEGPSFSVGPGNAVEWQRFAFTMGWTPREGLVLHDLTYAGRSVARRLSFAEMVVPYGDPAFPHHRKNAFDAGEDGLGVNAHSLRLGCDCLGAIHYTDVATVDYFGEVATLEHAICLHEEDDGLLWKHVDWRSNRTESRRSRRLVVSFICTVANYEYAFYYNLYQDATVELQVKLTGIVSTGALRAGVRKRRYGTTLTPGGLYAPSHQHFFCARLHMAVDGPRNSLVEVNSVTEPRSADGNPHGNAFYAKSTPLASERAAERRVNPDSARAWRVLSEATRNRTGELTSWKLAPGPNVPPALLPDADLFPRAAFLRSHLWCTPYRKHERYPAGDFPNQNPGVDGLPLWTQQDRPLANEELVLWYVFGVHHVVRLEDWPVMPAESTSFMLRPTGFFDASPCMDVAPSCAGGGRSVQVQSRL